jgi:hypothetical protein
VLLEKDAFRIRVSFFLKKVEENTSILQIHPMRALLMNKIVVTFKPSIFDPKLVHFAYIITSVIVPLIGSVMSSDLY